MKKGLVILGVAALGLASCQQFKKGEGDLEYKIHEDKTGALIKEGDFVALKAIQKTEEDSVMFNSYDDDRLSYLEAKKPLFKGDLYAAIGMLSEGDSATFKINIDSMVAKMGMPKPTNTKGKHMIYTLKIEKVIQKGKLDEKAFNDQVQNYFKKEGEIAKSKEAGKLSGYISSKGLKPETTASGLKYVVTKMGAGPKASVGDTVELNYTGSFVTGKVFDTSLEDVAKKAKINANHPPFVPLKIPAGVHNSIPGFDEGLLMFPVGSKVTLIMPSSLAYGERGNQMIAPFTPLVFDIEILKITKAKPGSVPAAPAMPPAPPAQ